MIAEAWSGVLGGKEIGIHDNYFALSGDSIKSLQVVVLKEQLDLSITFEGTRFQKTSIRSLMDDYYRVLRKLCEHCRGRKEREMTPGDFSYSKFSMEDFGNILEELE